MNRYRIAKALRVMGSRRREDHLARWRNVTPMPELLLADPAPYEPPLLVSDFDLGAIDPIRAECWADVVAYLPNDVLLKVDRASMAVSLEAREPLLDHRLFEFASRIPVEMLIRGGRGKWILREALHRTVPAELVEGPKKGFALPVAGWIVDPLRDWAESLLDESRLRTEGHFDARAVRRAWESFLGPDPHPLIPIFALWSILSFQAWLEAWN
jgi:asparagine synthase (glutamine-hydrolysing)